MRVAIPFATPTPTQGAAVKQFGAWVRRRFPQLHAEILRRHPDAFDPAALNLGTRLSGLGQDPAAEPDTDWGTRLTDIAKAVLTAWQSQQLFRANLKLAEQGKPPLDPSVYSPQVGVKVGIGPEAKTALLWGGVGIAALWIITLGAKHYSGKRTP